MSARPFEIRGGHVLAMMVGFFAVILLVNLLFIYLAVGSFTGIDTEQAYQKGLGYNDTLQAAENQRELGWAFNVNHEDLGDQLDLSLQIVDRYGNGIEGLEIEAELRRPTDAALDRGAAFTRYGGGRYGASIPLPSRGNWTLRLTARRDGQPDYRWEKRLWLN
ncbi:MAG: FixH family protein [Pseudomonadota bacterium]